MRERFTTALKEAMKAGDKRTLGTVRLIQAALKDKDIEARGAGKDPLSDDEILALLQKMIKQRQESLDDLRAGQAAPSSPSRSSEEIAIIATFLPKQMDEAEIKAAIDAAIAETGAAVHEGHGQGHGRPSAQIRRPDGFRQGQRPGEGDAAEGVRSGRSALDRTSPCIGSGNDPRTPAVGGLWMTAGPFEAARVALVWRPSDSC